MEDFAYLLTSDEKASDPRCAPRRPACRGGGETKPATAPSPD